MSFLRRYTRQDVLSGARRLEDQRATGLIGRPDYALTSSLFLFRDDRNTYWFLDVATGRWHHFEGDRWQPAPASPDLLEGPSELARYTGVPEAALIHRGDSLEGIQPGEPVKAFRLLLQQARDGYHRGRYTSLDAALLLSRLYLVDRQGHLWTMGFHSGRWYRSDDQAWKIMDQAPEPRQLVQRKTSGLTCAQCGQSVDQSLVCPQCGAALPLEFDDLDDEGYARLAKFMLLNGGSLPEAVTEPWEPPQSLPNLLEPGVECPQCAAHNPPGSRFCNRCGELLGCPACGKINRPGSRFCSGCGQTLVEAGTPI